MNFSPTPEQQAVIDAFQTGENLVIEAGAGTGKTSTLRLLAESTTRLGIYVAYNKAIQMDAKESFPENVDCRTAHSLAYAGMMRMTGGKTLMARGKNKFPSYKELAIALATRDFQIDDEHIVTARMLAGIAAETVKNFCKSADDEISIYHVHRQDGLEEVHNELREAVLPYARKLWADVIDPKGTIGWGKRAFDFYLKIWALSNPRLNAEFILFDEAQDANPVIAKIVTSQDHAQQIMVGDRSQAIYGWNGAIDAMSKFEAEHHLILSQSFRFGHAVAEQANKWLNLLDAPLRLTGFEKIDSTVEPLINPDAILCRTNAGVLINAMDEQKKGKKVAIVGGTGEIKSFAFAALSLMKNETPDHPELGVFKNWQEVCDYVQTDEGTDLKVMVNIMNTYGPCSVIEVCNNSVDEKSADLVVSTAHKAKGREWNKVRIAEDFRAPQNDQMPSRSEMMLLYVSVTRAQMVLDNQNINWIDALIGMEIA